MDEITTSKLIVYLNKTEPCNFTQDELILELLKRGIKLGEPSE